MVLIQHNLLIERVQSDCAAVLAFWVNSLVRVFLIECCRLFGLNLKFESCGGYHVVSHRTSSFEAKVFERRGLWD